MRPRSRKGAPRTVSFGGPQSQKEPTARTASSGRDQGSIKVGPQDWSILGAAERSPGLDHPRTKGSSPGLDHKGLNKQEIN